MKVFFSWGYVFKFFRYKYFFMIIYFEDRNYFFNIKIIYGFVIRNCIFRKCSFELKVFKWMVEFIVEKNIVIIRVF